MNAFLMKITINSKLIHHLYCLVNIWTAILKKSKCKHLFSTSVCYVIKSSYHYSPESQCIFKALNFIIILRLYKLDL